MRAYEKFYIGGAWNEPADKHTLGVINPATERPAGTISLGDSIDVDRAVTAAKHAFETFSRTTREERVALLGRIVETYQRRYSDMAAAITEEMGAPASLARSAHAALGLAHFQTAHAILQNYAFAEMHGTTRIVREPIGVCALITPWNWPVNQMACKIAPALAVGCTIILKPSEVAPFSGQILAEILDEAGVPPGVFNLVNGDGPGVGACLSAHPDVDLVSFTGSTRAGIEVARVAAATVKRVHQELGGKSPNIILPDADLESAVVANVRTLMMNSGQSCNAPTRMLVHHSQMRKSAEIAGAAAEAVTVGDPSGNFEMGPVVSSTQWTKIQGLIAKGIEEGATLVTGGLGKPDGLHTGFYVKPTIFADVTNQMTIAREEIFGPVLAILGYDTVEEAIAIGNDTPYGLAAYVQGRNPAQLREVASRLRAGQVIINSAPLDIQAPFGGYKQSGNGREWGELAFTDFLEIKAEIGFGAIAA